MENFEGGYSEKWTCRQLRERFRSLQDACLERPRELPTARLHSASGFRSCAFRLLAQRPLSADVAPWERPPPSVFSNESSGSTCVTCRRPFSAVDQNRAEPSTSHSMPASQHTGRSSLASKAAKRNFRSRSVHWEDCQLLIEQIDRNYPKLLSILEPLVLNADADIGLRVLRALRQRDTILRQTLVRTKKATILATPARRQKLIDESNEAAGDHLDCVALIDEILRIFFPKGEHLPTHLRSVETQMLHLQKIFSVRWHPE
ncbi:hypothetical protein M3Y99_01261300 [Aphelenchoides fujianensis]|nr:hypothetical protein M3Y99_01261300 [Aphelenchoides fujianensis]